MHHYHDENGKLACTNTYPACLEDFQTACFYHIMRQRIPNFANADQREVVANTTTTKRLEDLFNQCTSNNIVVSICEELSRFWIIDIRCNLKDLSHVTVI